MTHYILGRYFDGKHYQGPVVYYRRYTGQTNPIAVLEPNAKLARFFGRQSKAGFITLLWDDSWEIWDKTVSIRFDREIFAFLQQPDNAFTFYFREERPYYKDFSKGQLKLPITDYYPTEWFLNKGAL